MEQPDRYFKIAELISKKLSGRITPGEATELEEWIGESKDNRNLWEKLSNEAYLQSRLNDWDDPGKDRLWQRLQMLTSRPGSVLKQGSLVWRSLRYAAVILPLLAVTYFGWRAFVHKDAHSTVTPVALTGKPAQHNITENPVLPGKKMAMLILSNGRTVNLDNTSRRSIIENDSTRVQNQSSQLVYAAGGAPDNEPAIYNTLVIPRGGEYRLVLEDGTRVWLNAASSLRFPTRFTGKERKVTLTGEAYFEVAADSRHPFIVTTGKVQVKVLGTKFNIKAYDDESYVRTSLTEGKVEVDALENNKVRGNALLSPGYQAIVRNNSYSVSVEEGNMEEALAWKKGLFVFDNESLGSVLRKLSRWYNVDIVYDKATEDSYHFTGRIKKYENIDVILKLMELTRKVDFSLSGHTLSAKATVAATDTSR